MPKLFTPDYRLNGIAELTPEFLRKIGAAAVVADLDNTLALPHDPVPTDEGRAWLELMRGAGIPVTVASNNSESRAAAFCVPLDVAYLARCKKPLGGGVRRAAARMGVPPERAVLVGDQIFTDVLAARLAGTICVLTRPIVQETGWFFRLKRRLEKIFIKD